jgi:hypothetical protein
MFSTAAKYLAKAIPLVKGRIVPILQHAEQYFAKQPEIQKSGSQTGAA